MKTYLFQRLFTVVALTCACDRAWGQDLENIKEQKWAEAHGSLSAGVNLYGASGIAPRRQAFSWFTAGNATVTIKGLALPFSFQYSEQQRDFRQPFNQFGVSPTYKWMKMHLGWRNMSFSRYTLDGHVFLGAGIELNPGKLRFGAMYGRFLKAVQEDSNLQVYNKLSQVPHATYTRLGYSVKLGYGTEKNFVDLIYFKAKDDPNSVKSDPVKQLVAPGENAVLGMKLHLSPFKNFTVDADAAISAVTRDTRSDSVLTEDANIKYAKLIMAPRLSTQAYYAVEGALGYKISRFMLQLKLQRIMPDYRSYGTYYMQTDVQRITFAPQYNSKNGRLILQGSIGKEHDNLAEKKVTETNRTIGSLNLNWRATDKLGFTAQYGNYGMLQKGVLKSISDTVLLNQVNRNVVLVPYYLIPRKNASHTIMYMFSNQALNDLNKVKVDSLSFTMNMVNHTFTYSVGLVESRMNFTISVFTMNTQVSQVVGGLKSQGITLGVGKTSKDKKWVTQFSNTLSSNSFNGKSDGHTIQARWNNTYRFTKKHALSANLTLTNNKTLSNAISKSFTERLAMISYNYNF